MNELNNKPLKPKPQLLNDIKALAKLLHNAQLGYPHSYKYGYGNRIQFLVTDMVECYHISQEDDDFKKRSEALKTLLIKLDSIFTLMEIISSIGGISDSGLNIIYRQMDKIAKQTKGLRKYFAGHVDNQRITPPLNFGK